MQHIDSHPRAWNNDLSSASTQSINATSTAGGKFTYKYEANHASFPAQMDETAYLPRLPF